MAMTESVSDDTSARPGDLPRPQPLGVFDGPAGLLLVGPGLGAEELCTSLAAGRLPASWPASGAALHDAVADRLDAATAACDDSPVGAINRLVLVPTPEHYSEASRAAGEAAAADDRRLRAVVSAAAYVSGLSDDAPTVDDLDPDADAEFAVMVLTVRAARAMEFSDAPGALRLLERAAEIAATVGPALHGRVLGMVAEHRFRTQGGVEAALPWFGRAIAELAATDLDVQRAELEVEHGIALHQLSDVQPHRLVEAMRSYQSALIHLDEQRDPERFAIANMNIGIAILAMPMTDTSDQVKLGVAVQSLRAALRVYDQDRNPWEWSSSQMNLANALQYLPSAHREDNLREAVDLYEEVLGARSAASDPGGRARVLANQANALAHLAAFDDAEERYSSSRALFDRLGDADAVAVIDRQLAEIAERREEAR